MTHGTPADASAEHLAHSSGRSFGIVSADDFKSAFREHPGGVSLITADAGDGPVALTATSVASVSVDPPLLVFSVSALSSSAPTLAAAETVVVHLLEADQLPLAQLGATSGIDRFADTDAWTRLVTGEPVFHGVPRWIRARVLNRFDAGGSTVFVAHAVQVNVPDTHSGRGLVYVNRQWHHLGEHSRIEHP
ncbi:flavin reductase family protein [Microbacterium rhizomatis]|uniref:Flavin reductase family protein n=1 Tax=Microbacterium rhizomatis TaxID=1631477 RepID=A0A5J5J8E0_9MICO|nr:flavin reductase family protein [Microbacterium rhizomatis]KAA9111434.1 flavin reductase family protein [Microbacterium rhizomatis]